ncbi:hypothetical protein LTR67_006872 [Exophiala xenobiotica]
MTDPLLVPVDPFEKGLSVTDAISKVTVLAFNVLLTVRTSRNAHQLKKIDFCGICFAFVAPFIPALVFLCWRPDGRTVYGDATLWCWIAKEKDILRLVEFYVPIWVMILISICLFALSGKQILQVRKKLKVATCEFESGETVCSAEPKDRRFSTFARSFMSRTFSADSQLPAEPQSTFSFDPESKALEPLAPTRSREVLGTADISPVAASIIPILDRQPSEHSKSRNKAASRFDKIHWKYAKFAFLCTVVLFITWVPISVNRVYNNFINPDNQIYGLYFASALCIPLHGFGNFFIYTATSWAECREFLTCSGNRSSSSSLRRSSQVRFREPGYIDGARPWMRTFAKVFRNREDPAVPLSPTTQGGMMGRGILPD